MRITITGSMKFYEKYVSLKNELESSGHSVIIPLPDESYSNNPHVKLTAMKDFNNNLKNSDSILVANYEKNNTPNYIGINTIMEVGMAFILGKKVFVLNNIPPTCKEEFDAIGVIPLNSDISKIQ